MHLLPEVSHLTKTAVQYHNHSIDIDTVNVIPITTFPSPQGLLMVPFITTFTSFLPPLPSQPLKTTHLFLHFYNISFQEFCIIRIVKYVSFWGLIFSLSAILWRLIWAVTCINTPFLFVTEQSDTVYACVCLFNHSTTEGPLGCSQFKALTNETTINICTGFPVNMSSLLWDKCPKV